MPASAKEKDPHIATSPHPQRWHLTFNDAKLEREFWRAHDTSSLLLARVAWWLGIGLIALFGPMLNAVVTHGGDLIYKTYFGIAIPALFLTFLTTFSRKLDRWRHWSIFSALLVSTLVINNALLICDPPMDWVHSSNIIIISFTFAFVIARFTVVLLNALITTSAFEISLLHTVPDDPVYILYSNSCYFSVLLVSAAAGFMLEKSHRRNFIQARELARQGLIAEQNRVRSDELLLNILPADVADELKSRGEAKARQFDRVSILFSDFKGFTSVSEQLSPQELVEELNTCFKAFDNITAARGIEKIKTIGDAYMCAGGLPDPKSSSPADVVHAALEMQAFMIARKKEREALGQPAFDMRAGIHTGPVVAGIVGVKKFQYDIWGDTVNTASRMESSGEVGQVNISEATYALVKNETDLTFTPRGKVQAKGKGEMEMYFVKPI